MSSLFSKFILKKVFWKGDRTWRHRTCPEATCTKPGARRLLRNTHLRPNEGPQQHSGPPRANQTPGTAKVPLRTGKACWRRYHCNELLSRHLVLHTVHRKKRRTLFFVVFPLLVFVYKHNSVRFPLLPLTLYFFLIEGFRKEGIYTVKLQSNTSSRNQVRSGSGSSRMSRTHYSLPWNSTEASSHGVT